MTTVFAYAGAAVAEIAGCFAFWAWLRLGKSGLWLLPGVASLALFAYLLTLVDSEAAGRTYAAYGGVYIVASIMWLWLVERQRPDNWDLTGGAICLVGATVILFAPRSSDRELNVAILVLRMSGRPRGSGKAVGYQSFLRRFLSDFAFGRDCGLTDGSPVGLQR